MTYGNSETSPVRTGNYRTHKNIVRASDSRRAEIADKGYRRS